VHGLSGTQCRGGEVLAKRTRDLQQAGGFAHVYHTLARKNIQHLKNLHAGVPVIPPWWNARRPWIWNAVSQPPEQIVLHEYSQRLPFHYWVAFMTPTPGHERRKLERKRITTAYYSMQQSTVVTYVWAIWENKNRPEDGHCHCSDFLLRPVASLSALSTSRYRLSRNSLGESSAFGYPPPGYSDVQTNETQEEDQQRLRFVLHATVAIEHQHQVGSCVSHGVIYTPEELTLLECSSQKRWASCSCLGGRAFQLRTAVFCFCLRESCVYPVSQWGARRPP